MTALAVDRAVVDPSRSSFQLRLAEVISRRPPKADDKANSPGGHSMGRKWPGTPSRDMPLVSRNAPVTASIRKESNMSTQIRFDIGGLRRAIELGDCIYQLALYADNAEVSIVDSDDPRCPPRVLHGKPAIAKWINDVRNRTSVRQVLNPQVGVDRLVLTEECQAADGSSFDYSRTAEVHGGRITRETVTKKHPRRPSQHNIALPGQFLG